MYEYGQWNNNIFCVKIAVNKPKYENWNYMHITILPQQIISVTQLLPPGVAGAGPTIINSSKNTLRRVGKYKDMYTASATNSKFIFDK